MGRDADLVSTPTDVCCSLMRQLIRLPGLCRILYQKCEGQENQCRITLGGSIECLTKEDTQMWMTEMLFMSMRWENKLVGPRFCLTSD